MTIELGAKFHFQPSARALPALNAAGWAGSRRGVVEAVDGDRISIRFRDGQPWHFERISFEGSAVEDQTEPWEEEE